MKKYLLIITLISIAILGAQTTNLPLSLEQARQIALENNPDYQAKLAALNSAKWSKNSALSSFLPSLSLSGTYLYMDPATVVTTGTGPITLNKDYRTIGLSLSQPLFVGGKLWQAYQMAKIAEEMAATALNAQKLTLTTEVDNRYLAVLQTQTLLEISRIDRESAARNQEIAKLKYDNGLLSSADYLKFQSRLASKEVALLQSESAYQLAQLSLRNYLGLNYLPEVQDIPDPANEATLTLLDGYDKASVSVLSDKIKETSLVNSPTLKLTGKSVELSKRTVNISKGAFLPSLILTGSRQYKENGIDRWDFSPSDQLMITASIPILPQLGNYANLRKTQYDYQKALLEAQTAEDGILLGAEAAVLNLVSAAKQVSAAKLAQTYTEQSYEQLQERFRMNLISSTELLDADLMLSSARMAYTNSVYAYHKAKASLLQISGIEDSTILNEMIINGVNK